MQSLVRRLRSQPRQVHLPSVVRNRFPHPRFDQDLPLIYDFKERDPQSISEISPPEDERIDMYCTWGVEFYTPTHFEPLVQAFTKLGAPSDARDPSERARVWLNGLTRNREQFSWMHIGHLVPKGSGLEFGRDTYEINLPQNTKYAIIGIYATSPSLVAVVVCFVFNDDASTRFDKALRKNSRLSEQVDRNGYEPYDPRKEKTEDIESIRTSLRRDIEQWFSHNFPGLFSPKIIDNWLSRNLPGLFSPKIIDNWFSDSLRGLMSQEVVVHSPEIPNIPTCEFITLHKAEPFPSYEERSNGHQDFLDILGLQDDYEVWQSSRIPGLKFRMPDESGMPNHSLLVIKEGQHTRPDRDSRIEHINRYVTHFLRLWALLPMIERYNQHLNKVRDSVRLTNRIEVLEALKSEIAYNVDISAVTSELSDFANQGRRLIPDIDRFDLRNGESQMDLRDGLETVVAEQVERLQKRNTSLRDHLMRYGTLVGAVHDVQNQKRTSRLTWVSLIMAGVMLLATAHSLWQAISGQ